MDDAHARPVLPPDTLERALTGEMLRRNDPPVVR